MNELYNLFDERIENYNVYKVKMIFCNIITGFRKIPKSYIIRYHGLISISFILLNVVKLRWSQIDSRTIDGKVEFVHSQYSCILTSQVSIQFYVSDKIINNSDNFRIKCLSYSKISAILCVLNFLFLHSFI